MSVKYSLLALLSTRSMYGQQLKAEFEARTGEMWPLNVGQVYTSLNRLERDGFVVAAAEGADDDARRPYEITPAGEVELGMWLREPGNSKVPPRDELVMKIMIAVSIEPDAADSLSHEVIQSHRRQSIEAMQRFTHLKADPTAGSASLMMCDAELFRLEAAVRWLDSVEARLRTGAMVTAPAAQIVGDDMTSPITQQVNQ